MPGGRKIELKPPSPGDPREAFLKLLLKRFDWDYGELWLVDPEDQRLRLRNSLWPVPVPESRMAALSPSLAVQRGVGLVGRAWSTGSWIWVPDVAKDVDFQRATPALADGLTSALALPLVGRKEVKGVIAMFSRLPRPEKAAQADAITSLAQKIYRSAWNARTVSPTGNRFRHLIEGMSDIAVVLDLRGTILYESAAVTRVLGYRLEERLGHNVFEFIHPDDQAQTVEAIRAGFQDLEAVQRVEVRARHKAGRWVWLETVGHVEADEDGGHVIVAVSRDVTDARLAREALAERDTRLQLLNAIARELIAGRPANEIITLTIAHVSRNHPELRVAYATLDESGIFTVTHSAERPGFPSVAGLSADASGTPAALQCVRAGEVLRAENVAEDERLAAVADELAATGTVALLNVPLRHSRRLLGLLCFNSAQPRVWSEHEESTLKEVADMLSIALREAQHVELRRMAEKNLRRATKDLSAIFEAFPELGQAGAGGAGNGPGAADARRPQPSTPSPQPPRKADHNLSGQDLHVLALVAAGLTNREIGARLSLSPYTVKDHVKAVMSKLGAKNRTEAVVIATKRGIV